MECIDRTALGEVCRPSATCDNKIGEACGTRELRHALLPSALTSMLQRGQRPSTPSSYCSSDAMVGWCGCSRCKRQQGSLLPAAGGGARSGLKGRLIGESKLR